ncbi:MULTISPECIES: Sec-independent protein translocase protein TatB [unclassified Sphingomonas]|jgi:sec-independent protein translocase protein TatB|uniref:Sec-independent protein translocase protein TatB n=2 Tax=Pseudomonadota TaxID=1224 RepID=UPI000B1346A5
MLDFNAPEFLVVAIVALIVIGPKDLPKAMRFVGKWFGKARAVTRQFRSGFDAMVREAELAELEKQWAAENARIMSEHPPAALPAPEAEVHHLAEDAPPVMVEQPAITGETPGVSAPKPKRTRKAPAAAAEAPVAGKVAKAAPKPRTRKAPAAVAPAPAEAAKPAANKPRTRKSSAVPPAEAAE